MEFRREWNQWIRYQHLFALMAIDLELLKGVMIASGMRLVTRCPRASNSSSEPASLRTNDAIIRYGGDEFLVVFPETGRAGAAAVSRQLENVPAMESILSDQDLRIGAVSDCHFGHGTRVPR
ncbi:MAG: diguanylate cyclase [Acidiferrobacteraceae bacterium]